MRSSTEKMLFNLSEKELINLKEFKQKHLPCSKRQAAFDAIPDDCFSYHYYPSTLGGLTKIECICGASWSSMDGSFYTKDVPEPKEIADEELIALIVSHLLSVLKRPGMYLGEASLNCFFFHMQGMWQSLLFLGKEDDYSNLTHQVDQRIINRLSKYDPHIPLFKNMLEAFGDDASALEYWRNTLIDCLKEEYPKIYEACISNI